MPSQILLRGGGEVEEEELEEVEMWAEGPEAETEERQEEEGPGPLL